jgi:putative nucleotidyltransferase with HDIG domain
MIHETKTWSELENSTDQQIIDWASQQSWGKAMAACMQNPEWHAEGDVWTHTLMVCEQLTRLEAWDQLLKADKRKLLLTALFHDSAKPERTIIEEGTGRIRSPKHAQFGVRIARRVLMDLDCDPKLREEICRLVRYHGRPPHLEEQKSPQRELIKLSWLVQHHLLYLFALADTRGRICEQSYSEETLELWMLTAEENHCLRSPFEFANDHARFLFYRGKLNNLHYAPHEEYRCKMTIMCGLPGAGKDTWLASHRSELPVVSLDEVRKDLKVSPTDNQGQVVQVAREMCKDHLRNQRDFAFNATNTTRQVRQLWVDLGADYSARIELVYVEPAIATLFSQNAQRDTRVPTGVIERLIAKMDPPTATECHELVWACEAPKN